MLYRDGFWFNENGAGPYTQTAPGTFALIGAGGGVSSDTWANIKALTPTAGTVYYATDLKRHVVYDGVRWVLHSGLGSLASNGQQFNLPNTTLTTEQAFAHPNILIPAGLLGPRDSLIVDWMSRTEADGVGTNIRMRIGTSAGSTAGAQVMNISSNSADSRWSRMSLRGNNSQTGQNVYPIGAWGALSTSSAFATTSIDFTVDNYITFTGQQGTASTGLPKLMGYSVSIQHNVN